MTSTIHQPPTPGEIQAAEPPSEQPQVVEESNKYSIYTPFQKKAIIFGAAAGALLSPLSGQIYFPGSPRSCARFTCLEPAYILCFIIFIIACVGCALAPNYGSLLALRALQSAGSSATTYIPMPGRRFGHYHGCGKGVIWGVISQYLGWRWIFWIPGISAGVVLVVFLFFMPETCRLIVGDGSVRPHKFYRTFFDLGKDVYKRKVGVGVVVVVVVAQNTEEEEEGKKRSDDLRIKKPNLIRTLTIFFEKEMFILLSTVQRPNLSYSGFFAIATSIPPQFSLHYGFDGLRLGLIYIPFGLGSIISVIFVGQLPNNNYRPSSLPKPQHPLRPYPRIIHDRLPHRTSPSTTAGVSSTGFSNPLATLIVDLNPREAGAASAANNVTRNLLGAATTAFVNPLLDAVGAGLRRLSDEVKKGGERMYQ
ncbi:MFS general substrate transporter [Poronia punctata]|nr:MFS general substrate transporter [Poronia punctata]